MHSFSRVARVPDQARTLPGQRSALLVPTLAALLAAAGSAQDVVGWGSQVFNSAWNQEQFAGIAAGGSHTVACRSDGSMVAWGNNRYGQTNVPALPPGLTYAQIAAGSYHTVALVQSGSYVTFGPGCPGSLGVPSLTAAGPPRVGQTMRVTLQGLPVNQALVLFGASNTSSSAGPLPISLSTLRLPGCWLRISPDVAIPVMGASGSATFAFPVPTTPAPIGLLSTSRPSSSTAAALLASSCPTLPQAWSARDQPTQ